MRGGRPGAVGLRRRDARLAERSVRIDTREEEFDNLADEFRRAGASEGVDTPAVDIADGVPSPLTVLADRAQLGGRGEPRLA